GAAGCALGADRLARGCRAAGSGAARGGIPPLARERRARRGAARLVLKDVLDCLGDARAALRLPLALAGFVSVLCALARAFAGAPLLRRRQVDAGAARLRQTDGNRLLGVACSVLALANLVDLGAHELAGLS